MFSGADGGDDSRDNDVAEQALLVEAIRREVLRLGTAPAAARAGGGGRAPLRTAEKLRGDAAAAAASTGAVDSEGASADNDALVSAALADVFSCYLLRRTKDTVDLGLPPKTRVLQWTPATAVQAAIVRTLHAVTLRLAGPASVVGTAVREAVAAGGGGGAGNEEEEAAAPTASAAVEDECDAPAAAMASVRDVAATDFGSGFGFVGGLAAVVGAPSRGGGGSATGGTLDADADAAADDGAASTKGGGAVSRLVMLMRKAANHPLLLRARYSNDAVLALAERTWRHDAGIDDDDGDDDADVVARGGRRTGGGRMRSCGAAAARAATALPPAVGPPLLASTPSASESGGASGPNGAAAVSDATWETLRRVHALVSRDALMSWAAGAVERSGITADGDGAGAAAGAAPQRTLPDGKRERPQRGSGGAASVAMPPLHRNTFGVQTKRLADLAEALLASSVSAI